MPKEWLPIYNYDDGTMAYLDYSHLHADNEPRVIVCGYNGTGYTLIDIIADDLGEFLLELVQQQLNSQE